MIIGVIMEANPLHNGHKFFIDQIKAQYQDATIIAVTSTSFSMRGIYSFMKKKDKICGLLANGINAVFELPFPFANQSADYFAKNSVSILKELKVDLIICGCENNDINKIIYFNKIDNDDKFKELLNIDNKSESLKKRYCNALKTIGVSDNDIELFNSPNFTLAYQYYKYCLDYKIPLKLIKRENNNKDIISATEIRNMYNNGACFTTHIPYQFEYQNYQLINQNLLLLTKYFFNNNNDNDIEGLNHYIQDKINDNPTTFDELIDKCANKKYSKSRIRRYILEALINNGQPIILDDVKYLRLLGFDKKGEQWLGSLSKEIKGIIFSNPNEIKDKNVLKTFDYENKSTKLYNLISNYNENIDEYKYPIKR